MPEIDNALLAEKGLGWRKLTKGEISNPAFVWCDYKGNRYTDPPNFAEDQAACIEMVQRFLEAFKNSNVTLESYHAYKLAKVSDNRECFEGKGLTLTEAVAVAFTQYFQEVMSMIPKHLIKGRDWHAWGLETAGGEIRVYDGDDYPMIYASYKTAKTDKRSGDKVVPVKVVKVEESNDK